MSAWRAMWTMRLVGSGYKQAKCPWQVCGYKNSAEMDTEFLEMHVFPNGEVR